MSWSAPRPLSRVAAAPPRTTSADCASWAFLIAVIVLVTPGPAVTAATPGTPVSRNTASAANTASTSWRTSTTRMPRCLAPTRMGAMCPPQRVNRNRTPCSTSTDAIRSPPFIAAPRSGRGFYTPVCGNLGPMIRSPWTGDITLLEDDLRRSLRGEVRFDSGHRALYATDASNYRQVPIGVVVPRDAEDLVAAVAACRRHGAPIVQRGAGTSLAGQCCNVAVVIDLSRHLAGVLAIDPERRHGPGPPRHGARRPARARRSGTGSPSAPIPPPTAGARWAA